MTLYEIEVRLRVTVMAEDEKTAKSKGRTLIEQGCGRLMGSEVVGYVKPATDEEPKDAA